MLNVTKRCFEAIVDVWGGGGVGIILEVTAMIIAIHGYRQLKQTINQEKLRFTKQS